jgi:AraC family transcriptional regulator of adaptative response/methylated-DNA-[protein]-cysteine methyltransferase
MAPAPGCTKIEESTATENDPRWAQVFARNRSADGTFWYSVQTTGIYCRPSCPSRTANPKNVALHDDLLSAKATGFRACKRCNPEEPSPLECLAKTIGLSASYFHRLFKATTGLTPKNYAAANRASRVREGLAKGHSVTEVIYDAGFNSSGRFYEKSNKMLGMTPTRYREGGMNEEIKFAIGQSSLGAILVASSAKGVVAILIDDDPNKLARDLQDRFPKARLVGGDQDYEKLVAQVVGLVEAPAIGLNLPLDVRGTAFQQRVWQALQEIPVGKTTSYSDIAAQIGLPNAARAVAGACAANNIAVAIPCHRVVRSDGSLSGYAWGVERKKRLLDAETSS